MTTPGPPDVADLMAVALANVGDAVIVVDEAERVLSVNKAAERLYDASADELIGRPLSRAYEYRWTHPEDEALARTALAKDGLWRGENVHVKRNGAILHVESLVIAERADDGRITRMVAVIRDVTERKLAEEALRLSEERLKVIIDSVHDYAIFTLDAEGHVTTWNDGARRLKGYAAEEIIGRPVTEFYTREDVAAGKPQREMETALRIGRSEDESWRVRKDGALLWVNEIMTPLSGPAGEFLGFTKVSRDLTARKRAEEALRQSEERLRLVIDSVKDHAIFTMDPTGCVTSWNPGAERIFGYTEQDIVGRHSEVLFTAEDRATGAADDEIRRACETGARR